MKKIKQMTKKCFTFDFNSQNMHRKIMLNFYSQQCCLQHVNNVLWLLGCVVLRNLWVVTDPTVTLKLFILIGKPLYEHGQRHKPHSLFHLHAGILRQFSTPSSVWKLQLRRGVKFRSAADPPLEVVSGPHYWWTAPVWTDKPEARSGGVSVWLVR